MPAHDKNVEFDAAAIAPVRCGTTNSLGDFSVPGSGYTFRAIMKSAITLFP